MYTSQKWCEPHAYNWKMYHESCLNDSLHLRRYAPCGVFSRCEFGGAIAGSKYTKTEVIIQVQKIFYLNVTFLYLEMLLHRLYAQTHNNRRGPGQFLCAFPHMSAYNESLHRDRTEIFFCGKKQIWEEYYRTNKLTISFVFSQHLKHTYRVMFMYQVVDKKDSRHHVIQRFRGIGFYIRPSFVNSWPYMIQAFLDNDLPFEYRFNIRVGKFSKIKLNHIAGTPHYVMAWL